MAFFSPAQLQAYNQREDQRQRLDAYQQAKRREGIAGETRQRSLQFLQHLGGPQGGAFGSANFPESGYQTAADYEQGLRDRALMAAFTSRQPLNVEVGSVESVPTEPRGIADDPTSTFNTQEGSFGRFGRGTSGSLAALLGVR